MEFEGVTMSKYLRLMDGNKSNAGGFEIKIDEVVVADKWNPKTMDPSEMGGFNFSTDKKIIRWIHRGDTLYDVELPEDAEVIDCPSPSCPHGVFRTNKIIMKNPRELTNQMVMDFYKISELPLETYYQLLVILSEYRNYVEVAEEIIKDKINNDNINECILGFEDMVTNKHDGNKYNFIYDDLTENGKFIYDKLLEIKNNK